MTQARVLMTGLAVSMIANAAAAHPTARVIANGGATVTGSGRVLQGTIGQAIIGSSRGTVAILDHGWWVVGGSIATGVGYGAPDPAAIAAMPVVGAPSPNPATGVVCFGLDLPRDRSVGLEMFDVRGRGISRIPERPFVAGHHSIEWTRPAGTSPGVYFARISVDGHPVAVRRIVLLGPPGTP